MARRIYKNNWQVVISGRKKHYSQQHIKTMLNLFLYRKSVLACSTDCPADNHARPLAQFLYGTLYTIAGSEWSSFEDPGLIFGGTAKGKGRTYFLLASPSI